ncbi:uncharacterized protein LOC141614111 [Silene latifolia]|uniref:uncharacterized protein LOC141614111 n=1 Tax=Silene latifolia TaxID=37657 RepID=UPI003D7784FF
MHQWVHQLFLKGCPWSTYLPKSHLSGNWKAICRTRDAFSTGYLNGVWLADPKGYSLHSGYQWLRHKEPKVGWAKLVWCNWAIPKHCFLNWLLMKNALNTKVRLYKIGIYADELCCICGTDKETITHLFQHCRYVTDVLSSLCSWLQIPMPCGNRIIWLGTRKWPALKKLVCVAVFMSGYYAVWQQRNAARIDGVLLRPDILSLQCKA